MRKVVWIFVAAMFAAAPALAQTALLDQARVAILRGDIAEGERLLAQIDANSVDPNDLDFLRGTIATAKGNYKTAEKLFKAVLNRDSSANRVRLDLARVYFMEGDDVAAEHYFRAAMAQGVPPEVQHNIDLFLDQIRRRKRWDIGVQLGVAPDTNINAATTADTVTLYGLPFQLDPTAQRKSGVGLHGALAGAYQWTIAPDTKLKVGAGYDDVEYADVAFSDRNLSVYAGPRFLFDGGREVSVLAMAGKRWLGGNLFTTAAGGRIEGQAELSAHLLLSGTVFGQAVTYENPYTAYSGPVLGVNTSLTYARDSHSFYRFGGGIVREQADVDALRDTQYSLSAGYYRDALPKGFAVYAEARATFAPYDAPLPAFGRTRRDWEFDYRLSVSNSRLDIHGFTPVVSFLHIDRYSNLTLYGYSRNRVEMGVTRNF
jgi:thioredoxin-like negative regulator of GroEL